MDPLKNREGGKEGWARFWGAVVVGTLIGAGGMFAFLGPSTTQKAGPEPTPASEPGRQPCGDVEGLHVCIDKAQVRSSVSNGFQRITAGRGAAYVLAQITVSSSRRKPITFAWSDFALRLEDGTEWEASSKLQLNLVGGGYQVMDMLETVGPNTAEGGWLAFRVAAESIPSMFLRYTTGGGDTLDLALPFDACGTPPDRGVCMPASSCTGKRIKGLCSGGDDTQCCIP